MHYVKCITFRISHFLSKSWVPIIILTIIIKLLTFSHIDIHINKEGLFRHYLLSCTYYHDSRIMMNIITVTVLLRETVRVALTCLDPEGVARRKKQRLSRRKYFCKVYYTLIRFFGKLMFCVRSAAIEKGLNFLCNK